MTVGYLVVNLGSPDSYEVSDVRRYLDEFLMDPYVLDIPYLWRLFVVKCCILPSRPKESAEAYKSIWWDEGSPLIVISRRFFDAVEKEIKAPIALGMRYGSPSIESAIETLLEKHPNITELRLLPLYPHYALASTVTVIEKTKHIMQKRFPQIRFRYKESFYDDSEYIQVLSDSIKPYLDSCDHLLFSYHGVPERHVKKTDPSQSHCLNNANCCVKQGAHAESQRFCYRHHVNESTRLVVEKLGLTDSQYSLSFQSRLGKDPWLTPFTDQSLVELAKSGVKRLAVVCPAFVADCLETLEEIGEEGKGLFLSNGGESFQLIPCLNESESWVSVTANLLKNEDGYQG